MSNEDKIELQGIVTNLVLCKLSGKMRNNNIRIIIGDRVTLAVSPYDLNRGMIIWRDK